MNFHLSIKKKIIVGTAMAIIAASSMVGYYSISSSKEMVEKRLLTTELPAIVGNLAREVAETPIAMTHSAEQLARNPLMIQKLENPQAITPEEDAMLVKALNEIRAQFDLEDASIANRKTGHYWNQDGFLRKLNREDDGWFFKFTSSNLDSQVNIYNNRATGEHKMFVNYQMQNGHTLAGFSKSISDMIKLIDEFEIEKSGFVFLAGSEGLIQIHSDESIMGKKTLNDIYGPSSELLTKQDFSYKTYDIDGEQIVVASSYIPSMDWYLIAQVPKSEVLADINDAALKSIILIAGLILIACIINWIFAGKITKPLNDLANTFKELGEGEGDLSYRITIKNNNDEIDQLANGFNLFIGKIQNVTSEVAKTGLELNDAINALNTLSSNTQSQSEIQRDQTIQVVAAISQMSATINEIASNASNGANSSQAVEISAQQGQSVVAEAKETINQLASNIDSTSTTVIGLAEKTNQVGSILDVIRNISEQTNLLALNAAIEAARAGEQGRGFAVVADEVRNLASKTADSTNEIQSMIDELQDQAQQAVEAMESSKAQTQAGVEATDRATVELEQIAEGISQISNMTTTVATATEEQSSVVAEINMNIETINEVNNETTKSAGQIADSTHVLSDLSNRLKELVSSFEGN